MMNDALIEKYIGTGVAYSDFKILNEVDIDNVSSKLNQLCFGRWSYDVDIINNDGNDILIKVTFYSPIKSVCGFAKTTYDDINNGIKVALVDAVKMGFNYKDLHSDESNDKKDQQDNKNDEQTALTTLEEIEKMEEELGIHQPIKDNEDSQVKPQNQFGIRQDQIDFMNKFQEAFKIDNEVKFDSYVNGWNTMRNAGIVTKRQLISSGPKAIDDFISWVKEVYKDNLANNNFVCPSDSDFNECCVN